MAEVTKRKKSMAGKYSAATFRLHHKLTTVA